MKKHISEHFSKPLHFGGTPKSAFFSHFTVFGGPKKNCEIFFQTFFHISSEYAIFNPSNVILFIKIEIDMSELLIFSLGGSNLKPRPWNPA